MRKGCHTIDKTSRITPKGILAAGFFNVLISSYKISSRVMVGHVEEQSLDN